jgi:hypothetical protein
VAALWKIRLINMENFGDIESFGKSCFSGFMSRHVVTKKDFLSVASKGTWMVDHLDHGFEDVFNTLSILSFHHHFGILTSIFTHSHGFPSLFITFPSVWRFSKF